MAEAAHSSWSASGFEAIRLCPGKKVLEHGLPNRASQFSSEGTAYHQVLTWALQEDKPASAYVGRVLMVEGFRFEIDAENAAHVQTCIDYVHDVAGTDGVILVDIKVNYAKYLGVPEADAWGTADVIILKGDEIIVIDLKFGRGVAVDAGEDVFITDDGVELHISPIRKPNAQMALYALGALNGYNGLDGEFSRVRMVISQPRITSVPSEYDLSVEELEAWAMLSARDAVTQCQQADADFYAGDDLKAWEAEFLRPGEKQCKFCRAKATCPALRNEVVGQVFEALPATADDFDTLHAADPSVILSQRSDDTDWLAASLGKVDLIEDWCKAVRAEVERRMLAGETVPGYKLVEGKLGNRAWTSETEAEALLKSMRLKQEELYDFSVKSPTNIAKLGPQFDKDGKIKPPKDGAPAPVIGPRQWPRVAALITRAPAKKHVAPASDPRPALIIAPVADDFYNVSQPTASAEFNDLA